MLLGDVYKMKLMESMIKSQKSYKFIRIIEFERQKDNKKKI